MNHPTAQAPLGPAVPAQVNRTGSARLALVLAIVFAALLRFWQLGLGPPGLNQDEAANAWNAYCLLKTGVDQVGQPWPVFYTRALGENRSTLFIYLLIPFQALFGLNPLSTRLLAPVCGVMCIPLLYYVGTKWFDRRVGLVAAAALAVHPWHIQHSRWGHESSIVPFLVLLPIATAIWAGLPLAVARLRDKRVSSMRSLLAGLLAGIACYGYPCVRLFIPALLLLTVAATRRGWAEVRRTARGRCACLAALVGFCITFLPLAIAHVIDPEINKRGEMTRVWRSGDSVWERCEKVLERYAVHYDPVFLFLRGDAWEVFSPPGGGMFHWTALPLMLCGVVVLLRFALDRRTTERTEDASEPAVVTSAPQNSSKPWQPDLRTTEPWRRGGLLLFVLLMVYPAGDVLSGHPTAHALRSLPGIIPLNLLIALGAVAAWDFLRRTMRSAAIPAATIVCLAATLETALDQWRRLTEFNERPRVYHDFYVDLLAACDYLRPRFDSYDAVFLDDTGMPYPYVVLLTGLEYDPQRWRDEPRDWEPSGWDIYRRFGRVFLLSDPGSRAELERRRAAEPSRVVIIARPAAVEHVRVLREIVRPDGKSVLWVCEPTENEETNARQEVIPPPEPCPVQMPGVRLTALARHLPVAPER